MIPSTISDIRYAFRTLGRNKAFTASAVLTLALGIGVNTTIFSIANGALFRSRPGIKDPKGVVWLSGVFKDTGRRVGLSYPEFLDYRAGTSSVFSDVAGYRSVPLSLGSGGSPVRVRGQMITGSLLPMLGVSMTLGRTIEAADDVRGAPAVAIISERLWTRRFNASADILRTPIILNGRDVAVVGVAASAFRGPAIGDDADVWMPMSRWPEMRASERDLLDSRGSSWLTSMARLRAGVSVPQAQAVVSSVARQLAERYPDVEQGRGAVATGAGSSVSPGGRAQLIPIAGLLLSVTAIVLLIACANLANLLLARGAGRTLEISIRSSLGASRSRLIRQLMTESAVLAAAGAALGLLLASWGAPLLVVLGGSDLAGLQAMPDYRAILFAIAAGAVSVCLFALIPAFSTTRADLTRGLRSTPGAGQRSQLQNAFVVAQLALSLVLLLASALSLRALQRVNEMDLGFTPEHLTTASYDLVLQNYPEARREAFRRDLLRRVEALGGVESAAIANTTPLGGTMIGAPATAGGHREAMTFLTAVGPSYFWTLQIPLVRGRAIMERDGRGAPRAAVVNQTLARMLWGAADPIGQSMELHLRTAETFQVVGVARDAKYDDPGEDPQPFVYLSLAQEATLDGETLLVRSAGNVGELERVIHDLDPALPVYDVRPFSSVLRERSDKQRALGLLFSAFGALALALAAVGLSGVMAYITVRRGREFGLRLALGATPARLAAMVVRDAAHLGTAGSLIGVAIGVPVARAIATLLPGVRAADIFAFASVCAVLNAVVLVAAVVPARRAARLDPMSALRSD